MNESIVETALAALGEHEQVPLFSASSEGLKVADAYRVTAQLRAAFEARGEKTTGRKIGFTNRDMWGVYGVREPIWGYCTDKTTFELKDHPVQRVSDFVEPRIEPEIVFGLGANLHPSMDETQLLDCIEWVSLGYEVVQSIFAGWKFAAFDAIAANALHGALLIGNRHKIAPRKSAWQRELASFRAELFCDGRASQSGGGAVVLGSPLIALQHLVKLLAEDPCNPPLRAGEVVSTGTLTLAMAVEAGQTWTTKVHGIPLEDISLRFES
ncbi:hydratase [Ruegeria sediminis]|uniref:Hydratase n=1 Tax=Ruegeria sediminis TaxID=2583820 RepID=A0ABY2X4X8_9RHOB|nr:fumarylacetoacetate hydrolase family protein [Ruegeria sediminis]TMV10153.1 hydratase [Ruegeria sediminis]